MRPDEQRLERPANLVDICARSELFEFFRAYDLAMLRKARENAMARKLREIDAEAIRAAFAAWQAPRSGS